MQLLQVPGTSKFAHKVLVRAVAPPWRRERKGDHLGYGILLFLACSGIERDGIRWNHDQEGGKEAGAGSGSGG